MTAKGDASGRRGRGRPPLVGSDEVLMAARKMLSERSAATFSVRRLAEALSVTPGAIYARFGTKNELLAQAYLQRLKELNDRFRSRSGEDDASVEDLLRLLSGPLSDLRADFSLRFEMEGGPVHGVRSATWDGLRREYLTLVHRVYGQIRRAAARDGHSLATGTLAERLVWSLLSSGTSERNAEVFGHRNSSYFRFMARCLVDALGGRDEHSGKSGPIRSGYGSTLGRTPTLEEEP